MQFYVYSDHRASSPIDPADQAALKRFASSGKAGSLFVRDDRTFTLEEVVQSFLSEPAESTDADARARAISAAAAGATAAVVLGDDDNHLLSLKDLGRRTQVGHSSIYPIDRDAHESHRSHSETRLRYTLDSTPIAFVCVPEGKDTIVHLVKEGRLLANATLPGQVGGTTYEILKALADADLLVAEIDAAIGPEWQEDLDPAPVLTP